ncbi:hypothetical protein SAMN05216344_11414 [Polaromonas sp. OV174]|uniref:hypothetical protein n=1 Tax=Polaromonas sp. OV174 TaxID=1855300 RepID=UPI0008E053F0|nr:hypothetical protein [Polaromonas sp. OV174]SFC32486.1 hypothetical protein SAMN05216344_11414 [Polaromonas sp. OV174]
MENLSQWDFKSEFTGSEAAALILGIDPVEIGSAQDVNRAVIDRMELSYYSARYRLIRNLTPSTEGDYLPPKADQLRSLRMTEFDDPDNENDVSEWLGAVQSDFPYQKFTRIELSRWLAAIGVKSIYRFELEQTGVSDKPQGNWPWGEHHTKTLGYLESAAKKWWVNYDPSDVSTAPLNATVIKWLQTEFGISKTKANSIASMLRADGLPTGPHT